MTTSRELFAKAQSLIDQANQILRQEKIEVIREMKTKIATYGITAKELGLNASSKPVEKRKKSRLYLGPAGQEWSGRGRRPQWIKDAVAAGADPEQFRAK